MRMKQLDDVVLGCKQQTFESKRGLEGREMKNRASSRHVIRGVTWCDEAFLMVPARRMEGGMPQGVVARHGLTNLARETVLKRLIFEKRA